MSKYVLILGGLVSNIGKGTTAAALGRVFKNRGVSVTMQRFDQYLNIDPGTMSPYQHGEVFVTDDGSETSLNIGHYERFLDISMGKNNSITSGKIYSNVINNERLGKYLGSTVQVVPHVTNEIKNTMEMLNTEDNEIVIVEIGGTISDVESGVYYRAIREFINEKGKENVFLIQMDLLPFMPVTRESKIESIQSSVEMLNKFGLFPDAVICRTIKNLKLATDTKKRIATRCFLKGPEYVIQNPDVDTVYEVPVNLKKEGLDEIILNQFGLSYPESDLNSWAFMVENFKGNYPEVRICVVGKYTRVPNAYLSIEEAIKHASTYNQVKPKIEFIDAEDIVEYGPEKLLRGAKGIIVPSGWGKKGFEGMLLSIRYARERKIPFLGIDFGMQLAVIEFARNVLGYATANSIEIDPNTDYPVIDSMVDKKRLIGLNSPMRAGAFDCEIKQNTNIAKLYGNNIVSERHRHKFEFNNKYIEKYELNGMVVIGTNPESGLVEIVECRNHPFFFGTSFIPQFKSRPNRPHPIFLGFINATKSVR
ncbi:MAG: CTP synthase [Clostridia bacterium]|nr:CTP synthase [Clostridia bacterium]